MFCHVDVDAFFASVLQRKDPRLKGKPLLALGMGGGCVIAASYEAKAFGVKTGMPLKEARKLVPQAIAIPSDFHEACRASQELEEILRRELPFLERMSVDEWFGDLTSCKGGLPSDIQKWAEHMQTQMKRETALTVSIGIAPTKLLAKMASEYRKPAGITVLKTIKETETFLEDRPAAAIPGIGRRRKIHTDAQGWHNALQIAEADEGTIVHLFGRPGHDLQQELLGIPVFHIAKETKPPQSISRCRSFRVTIDQRVIFAHLLQHLSRTVSRMRGHTLACGHISVWMRDGEYRHWGTDRKIPQPADTEEEILPYVRSAFEETIKHPRKCTQIGLVLSALSPAGSAQYSLFEEAPQTDKKRRVQASLDQVRDRYGRDCVVRGSAMPIAREKREKTPDLYGRAKDVY